MHSKDIAWLAVAGIMSLKLVSGIAVAQDLVLQAPAGHTLAITVSQGEDARQACRVGQSG